LFRQRATAAPIACSSLFRTAPLIYWSCVRPLIDESTELADAASLEAIMRADARPLRTRLRSTAFDEFAMAI
jgi:hypothetical protein